MKIAQVYLYFILVIFISCQDSEEDYIPTDQSIIENIFGSNFDINNTVDYQNLNLPNYIRFAQNGNAIDNQKATLGRILFYDTQLSTDQSISCSSCHHQENAFSDTAIASLGVTGSTSRHSMRLVNTGYQAGTTFFWDERASSIEQQVTQPIRDHIEMGFSNEQGAPSFRDLLDRLSQIDYYQILFNEVYGDALVTESRLQECLSQFVLSIQSFDSKYDVGLMMTGNPGPAFPNYSVSENRGKFLFTTTRQNGGSGCVSCHVAPEFAIRANSLNNGVIKSISDPSILDHDNTRSPTLRDIVNLNGNLNGPLMHNGSFNSLREMIEHYNSIDIANQQNLDPILTQRAPNGQLRGQQLQLSETDKVAIEDFLKTLTGHDIYTNVKWSNPFIN